jgi:hypothetical protein
MKFTITPFVAAQIFSDNFPGRNLSQDISGLVNLLALQLKKRFKAGFDSLQEMMDYVSLKLNNITEELDWIFNSPGWQSYTLPNSDENKMEFGLYLHKPYHIQSIFFIIVDFS